MGTHLTFWPEIFRELTMSLRAQLRSMWARMSPPPMEPDPGIDWEDGESY